MAQVNHYVNVRQEPDTESEILENFTTNPQPLCWRRRRTVVPDYVRKCERICQGGICGRGDEELARSVGTRLATVTTTTLFVRTEPTTEAKVLTMLPDGDDVVVTDESTEGWAKVSTADGDGYVALDYVTLSTEYIHAESKAEEEARLAREEAERQAAARAAEEARKARERRRRHVRQQNREANPQSGRKTGGEKIRRGSSAAAGGSSTGSGPAAAREAVPEAVWGKVRRRLLQRSAVVDYARQFLGNPYVYGGNSPTSGTDCSGFVKGVYAAFESICRAHRRNSGVWDMPSARRKSSRATLSAIAATSASMRATTH